MVVPIANLSAVVTDAVHAAIAIGVEMLPATVTRDAVLEAARASVAWFLRHLFAWFVAARAVAVENLPVAAAAAKSAVGSAAEASEPWLEMAAKLLHELYGWLVAAGAMAVEKLPAAAAAAAKNAAWSTVDASQPWLEMAWKLLHTTEASGPSLPTAAHGVAVYVLLVLALLAVAFLCGAVWALTCRTMKGPGLGGARVPRAMFKANPRRYYAAVRTARKARRCASGAEWKLLVAAPIVACMAYLVAKTIY